MRQSTLGAFLFFFAFGLSACGGGEHDDESPSVTLDLLPSSAVRLDELVPGSRLAAGDQHSALIGENARINVWGNNQHGQRGIGSKQISEYNTPSSQIFITNVPVAELALGSAHTMALDEAGVVWSWGLNEHGQLGVDSLVIEFESPQKVKALSGKKIVRIAAGDANGLALDEHGALFAWGWNGWGQIGDGTKSASIGRIGDKLKPVQVKLGALKGARIVDITQGWATSGLLDTMGRIWTWGNNAYGQIGNDTGGNLQYEPLPTLVNTAALGDAFPVDIEFSRYNGLALDNKGRLWSWGWNNVGQLGTGEITNALSPKQINIPNSVIKFAAGAQHALALDDHGNLWAWGLNSQYQLGDGSRKDSRVPVRVVFTSLGDNKLVDIAAGKDFSIAIDDSGQVWGWGNNIRGEVGNTAQPYFRTPVLVSQN